MKQPPKEAPAPAPGNELVERLFVFWLASTVILLLALIVIVLMGSGYLRRQSEAITDLNTRIESLERQIRTLEASVQSAKARRTVPEPRVATRSPPESHPAAPPAPPPETRPSTQAAQATTRPGDARLAELDARLRGALKQSPNAPPSLGARADAEIVAALCEEADVRARMDGPQRAAAAAVLALLERPARAAALASEAREAGVLPRAYLEIAAREALRSGEGAAAVEFARQVLRVAPQAPEARLVLAQAARGMGDHATAIEALDNVGPASRLSAAEKLELLDLLTSYWRWSAVHALLSTEPVASAADARVTRARAAYHAYVGDVDVALAITDQLRAAAPDDYDANVYRAAALTRQGQYAAAAACLAVADAHPEQPEAWYWLGVLSLREGKDAVAARRFEQSVAASQLFAPANEALAALALNNDDILAARECAERAVQADDSRGEGHFLLALTAARLGERETAAASLRAALARDRTLEKAALEAESLQALFTPDEIASLAQPSEDAPAEAPDGAGD